MYGKCVPLDNILKPALCKINYFYNASFETILTGRRTGTIRLVTSVVTIVISVTLPAGVDTATIGTGELRRQAQWSHCTYSIRIQARSKIQESLFNVVSDKHEH